MIFDRLWVASLRAIERDFIEQWLVHNPEHCEMCRIAKDMRPYIPQRANTFGEPANWDATVRMVR
jgi:hypothetical protein